MNRRQARERARDIYGPGADVVNVSAKDRNQRFGVVYVGVGGVSSPAHLGCLGYGSSYDAALEMAAQNEVAKQIAERWLKAKADFKEFGEDPQAYIKKEVEKMEQTMENNNNG